jgi:hypothetical protein
MNSKPTCLNCGCTILRWEEDVTELLKLREENAKLKNKLKMYREMFAKDESDGEEAADAWRRAVE